MHYERVFIYICYPRRLFPFSVEFVAHSQAFTATSPACSYNSATIWCAHALTESVLIFTSFVRGLKGSFHLILLFSANFSKTVGKGKNVIETSK